MWHDREVLREQGAVALRRSKLMRVAEEAREQGGVLTQEDLGVLLACDERTIRRDIKALRLLGIHVPTRGYVQDIGPTLSHKGLAIRPRWLQGKEPVAIARAINHSLTAVERYLEDFKRVSFRVLKGMDEVSIAQANMSPASRRPYQGMYCEAKETKAYRYRFTELERMTGGEPADGSSSGKKGAK